MMRVKIDFLKNLVRYKKKMNERRLGEQSIGAVIAYISEVSRFMSYLIYYLV